jgi:glucokinase
MSRRAGARPTPLDSRDRPTRVLTLAIDLGGTFARAAVVDEKSALISVAKMVLLARTPEQVADVLAEVAAEALRLADNPKIDHYGVAVAAQLESDQGIVTIAPNLGWKDIPLSALLKKRLSAPVYLVNDLRAAAWGEYAAGAGAGVDDIFTVVVGSGVGSAIIAGGELLTGVTNVAGEFGHIKVATEGRLCGCGMRGCLEAYVGGHHLIAQMKEAVQSEPTALAALCGGDLDSLSPVMLEEALRLNDPAAHAIFERASSLLAISIANQITVLNPARLILGGGVLRHAPSFVRVIREGIERHAGAVAARAVEVVTSSLGDDAGLIGVALLASRPT